MTLLQRKRVLCELALQEAAGIWPTRGPNGEGEGRRMGKQRNVLHAD
jgi:hypothetical protein